MAARLKFCWKLPTTDVLGVNLSGINMRMALQTMEHWLRSGDHQYVSVTGVPGVVESQEDKPLRAIHNQARMVTPDGMPLVWLSRLHGHKNVSRVYGPDLMHAICKQSVSKGYRHFLYGGGEGVPELLAQKLQAGCPGLQIVGTYSPPFRPLTEKEDARVVDMINRSKPDIVWVGLSTPKQEKWMYEHKGKVEAPVMIGVGAAFDFHAGLKKQAPRWMQHSGTEWLFRVATEPKRLWKRYAKNNPRFVGVMMMQAMGLYLIV